MRKKALAKDFRMEIRNSLNRFLSIFFIVALGVAFFAGIRASEPDMRYSGDAYFDARNMMDMKILSTLGLTEDDIEAIRAVDGVEKVEPGYMIDVLALMGESERVIHVESLPETMNQVDVDEGRLPEKQNWKSRKRQWKKRKKPWRILMNSSPAERVPTAAVGAR